MKIIRKIAPVTALVLILALLLTACGKKEITAAEFSTKASSLGYQVEDYSAEAKEEYSHLQSYLCAYKEGVEDSDFEVTFMVANSEADAIGVYNHNETEFDNYPGGSSTTKSNHTNSFSKTSSGKFMYVCRVNATILVVEANETYKDEAKKLIKDLGY